MDRGPTRNASVPQGRGPRISRVLKDLSPISGHPFHLFRPLAGTLALNLHPVGSPQAHDDRKVTLIKGFLNFRENRSQKPDIHRSVLNEHRAIFQQIASGHPQRARQAVLDHLQNSIRFMEIEKRRKDKESPPEPA